MSLEGLDPETIREAVGHGPAAMGRACAGSVEELTWFPEQLALQGRVRAGHRVWQSVVYLAAGFPDGLVYDIGTCGCSGGEDCVHAVAVAYAAVAASPAAPAWEQDLRSLVGPDLTDGVGLAVELSVSAPTPGYRGDDHRLLARLQRPGRSGWVAGGLTWTKLDSAGYSVQEYRPDQVRLLQELYAMARPARTVASYYAVQDKTIDLAGVGPRLWPLLDEAASLGVALLHPRTALGPVAPYQEGSLELDVTARGEGLSLAPVLRGVPETQVPVVFLGREGHGVVCTDRRSAAERPPGEWPLRLVRLARHAPATLRGLVVQKRTLEVPGADRHRFVQDFYPRLRTIAEVGSSDGSFVPPVISGPTLVVRTDYGAEHALDVDWEWAYTVDGAEVRAPLEAGSDHGFRDRVAEAEALRALAEREPGLVPRPERRAGLETMRFTTETLPLLEGLAGDGVDPRYSLRVERRGESAEYREAGDSLRIAVGTADVPGETDWFDLGVTITVEGREVPFASVLAALTVGETHLLLPDGAYFALDKPELAALRALLEEARSLQDRPGPLRISRFHAGLWAEFAALGVVESQSAAWRDQVGGLLAATGVDPVPPPAGLAAELRPYQRDGFAWLAFLWRHGLGGILADDMGLGKTLQSLALICHAREAEPHAPPFLIVAPSSVVPNWAAEAARFAPGLRVVAITDTLKRRGLPLEELVAEADVVITSATLFRIDTAAYTGREWSGLLLDEAQFAKNHQSKVYQCARRVPARFRLAITGTPMENTLMELWSLLSITAPGLYPNPTRFREDYARPIERARTPAGSPPDSPGELLARLRRRIRPLMLRRTKELVAADLPEKSEQVVPVDLDPAHRRLYQRHLQRERQKVLGLIEDVDRNRFTILRSLTLLRRLSLHPGLIEPEQEGAGSAKLDVLVDELREVVAGGHRALVFSQFTGFLAHVRTRLDEAGIRYSYLDGSTRNRGRVVRGFTEGSDPVFLISLKAGGTGLNLTEADYCFLLDPWWNPAVEAQAIDRAHRIGQTRPVIVRRLIARDTIEEKVRALAERKAALFTGVLDEGALFGSALDAQDIRVLLE